MIEIPEGDALAEGLVDLDEKLAEEQTFWQNAQLPPAAAIYQMGQQEFHHHCHSEMFIELFRILGFSDDQMNYVFKTVALREQQGLRKIAKEARRKSIIDGILFNPGDNHGR